MIQTKKDTHKQKKGIEGTFSADFIGLGLLALFLILFFNMEKIKDGSYDILPSEWIHVSTIFLSIVLEAVPFILLGVFVSALIQVYIKEDTIQRYLPKNAYAALFPAAVLGALFPVCECAIIPVVRRLIKKGMPLHVGVVFLVAAPILNPVVFASTFFAFRSNMTVVYTRMVLAFILAILIGAILYLVFKNSNQIKEHHTEQQHTHDHEHLHDHHHEQKPGLMMGIRQTFYHATDEFFDMGKYLILGACITAMFQTFLDRNILHTLGSDEWSSTLVMMAFAYILSLCSEADAFVAASFGNTFTVGSIIAFLVYGPMLDLKNTIMLFACFRTRFVIAFMITGTVVVFAAVMLLQYLL